MAWAVDLFMYYDSDDYKSIKAKEYVKNNQYEQAIEYYQNMSDEKRANQEITKIGDEFLKKKSFDDAIRIYKIAKNEKKIKETRLKQADFLLSEREYNQASAIYRELGEKEKQKNVAEGAERKTENLQKGDLLREG